MKSKGSWIGHLTRKTRAMIQKKYEYNRKKDKNLKIVHSIESVENAQNSGNNNMQTN